jgi:pyruvate dehydrogenase E1 component alpha subunit
VEKIVTGFGLKYMKADGNDYEDVYKKAKKLIKNARNGQPAVLECVTYRHMAHSAPIFDESVRGEDVLEKRLEEDPVKKFRKILLKKGTKEKELIKTENSIRKDVIGSIKFAVNSKYPLKKTLYTDLYA